MPTTIGALNAGTRPNRRARPRRDWSAPALAVRPPSVHRPICAEAVGDAEVVWITFDTPVDDEDRADVDYVMRHVAAAFPHLKDGARGAQFVAAAGRQRRTPRAGLGRRQAGGRRVSFACSPENLRLGKAIEVFTHPDRVVIGVRDDDAIAPR